MAFLHPGLSIQAVGLVFLREHMGRMRRLVTTEVRLAIVCLEGVGKVSTVITSSYPLCRTVLQPAPYTPGVLSFSQACWLRPLPRLTVDCLWFVTGCSSIIDFRVAGTVTVLWTVFCLLWDLYLATNLATW